MREYGGAGRGGVGERGRMGARIEGARGRERGDGNSGRRAAGRCLPTEPAPRVAAHGPTGAGTIEALPERDRTVTGLNYPGFRGPKRVTFVTGGPVDERGKRTSGRGRRAARTSRGAISFRKEHAREPAFRARGYGRRNPEEAGRRTAGGGGVDGRPMASASKKHEGILTTLWHICRTNNLAGGHVRLAVFFLDPV